MNATSCFSPKCSVENLLDTTYHTYWASANTEATITVTLDKEKTFDIIVLQEYIPLGQRISRFHVVCGDKRIDATTIGYKRILRLPEPVTTDLITIVIDSAFAPPILNRISIHSSK